MHKIMHTVYDNCMCTLIYDTHSSSLSLCLHPLKPEISCHSWGFSETCSPFHLIGHEKWMTNINSDCHYFCVRACVCVLRDETDGLRVCVGISILTGKSKPNVFYLFLSLIAGITVYFQTAPRCGENTHTELWEKRGEREKQTGEERERESGRERILITENDYRKTEK